ncbi:MAG TPA: hypothetical protein VMA83_05040 [Solirubrobacteraceae bacterium]|nr:hypothetical protein [Solirubrobacteraceae bacterium]
MPARAAATAVPARTHRRRPVAPARPRRVSGPARRAQPHKRRERSLAARVDAVAGGRRWIAAIALGLIGIVLLQLIHLELTHGSGVAIEREETLERQNAALAIEDSERSSGQHVAAAAQALGMVIVPNGALHILSARGRLDARRAASALTAPEVAPESTPSTAPASETPAATETGQTGAQSAPAGETQSQASTPASGGAGTSETQSTAPAASETPTTEAATGGGAAAPAG